jgi:hypothetical protein
MPALSHDKIQTHVNTQVTTLIMINVPQKVPSWPRRKRRGTSVSIIESMTNWAANFNSYIRTFFPNVTENPKSTHDIHKDCRNWFVTLQPVFLEKIALNMQMYGLYKTQIDTSLQPDAKWTIDSWIHRQACTYLQALCSIWAHRLHKILQETWQKIPKTINFFSKSAVGSLCARIWMLQLVGIFGMQSIQ